MKKITIIGHFAFGKEDNNGQTIKTKIVTQELQRSFGKSDIALADTMGRWRFLARLPWVILKSLVTSLNIIVLPASTAVKFISPLLVFGNFFFGRKLHYVAIGAFIPVLLKDKPVLRAILKRFNEIYVETEHIKKSLEHLGFTHVTVMPNCKPLTILKPHELPEYYHPPFKLCTFSRVREEKGIGDAIQAVNACNKALGKIVFTLDIFGKIEQEEWFNRIMENQPQEISYGGIVPFNESTEVLRNYFALLFPTHYKIEGFAGTLIDAMASGLPTIASDCASNVELLTEGETGMLYPIGSVKALTDILLKIAANPSVALSMRPYCIERAKLYQPENVIRILKNRIV